MHDDRSERRRAPRAPVNVEMELGGDGAGAEGALATESLNLSAEGVYCTTPRYIAPLTRLELTLLIPNDGDDPRGGKRVVRCEAVAVRSYPERESTSCRAYELACYFTSMEEDDRRALREFLAAGARES
jgi:hypothetical protein